MKYLLIFFLLLNFTSQAQEPEILWQFDFDDMAFGQAAAADVDGDGLLEIAFSTYRNDGYLYMLNGEDGSVLWSADVGGCADAAPLIYDVDMDNDLEVILAGSCNPTTFCFDADSGFIQWQTPMRGSDSPPTVADIDNDGLPEILHGQFGGYVLCLNGEDGSEVWELEVDVDSWIQTAPTILDVNDDGQLDFVIATWSFYDNHVLNAYSGDNAELIWENTLPQDVIYHGVSYGDMDNDGTIELVIGDYAGIVHCVDATNGEEKWSFQFPSGSLYVGAPTSMGDINNDGNLEVVFNDWYRVGALDYEGNLLWEYSIPEYGQAFRGMALADVNGDEFTDVTFSSSAGSIISINGNDGTLIREIDLELDFGMDFDVQHGPLIADFNNDGLLDVFSAGGHAGYPDIENNYGAAYMVSWGEGNGPDWKMFRRDYFRTACICNDSLLVEEEEPVSLEEFPSDETFTIFPTIFENGFYIESNLSLSNMQVSLTSLNGALVYEERVANQAPLVNIKVPTISPGTYVLSIRYGDNQFNQLMIKQ